MKNSFPLEPNGSRRITITRGLSWKNAQVSLDGVSVLTVPDEKSLRAGLTATLPNGSSLFLKLSWHGLDIRVDDRPLPGTLNSPETMVKLAATMLLYVGGMNVFLGVVALASNDKTLHEIADGVPNLIYGAIMLILALFTRRQSVVALGLGFSLYVIDSVLAVVLTTSDGSHIGGYGAVTRVFVTIALARGLKGILSVRREKLRQSMFAPAVVPASVGGQSLLPAYIGADDVAWPRRAEAFRVQAPAAPPLPMPMPAPVIPRPPRAPLPWKRIGLIGIPLVATVAVAFGVWAEFIRPPSCPAEGKDLPTLLAQARSLRSPANHEKADVNAALACTLLACEQKAGCDFLADIVQHEKIVPRSLGPRISQLLEERCAKGEADACLAQASALTSGDKGLSGDLSQAIDGLLRVCRSEKKVLTSEADQHREVCDTWFRLAGEKAHFDVASAADKCQTDSGECMELGLRMARGAGVIRDPLLARRVLHWGCELQENPNRPVHKSFERAFSYYWRDLGKGGEEHPACIEAWRIGDDLTARIDELAQQCQSGNQQACFDHAAAVSIESHDLLPAADELKSSCAGGAIAACAWWGEAQRESGDFDGAHKTFVAACEKGHPYACDWLGYMARFGESGDANAFAANTHYAHACELGYPRACMMAQRVASSR